MDASNVATVPLPAPVQSGGEAQAAQSPTQLVEQLNKVYAESAQRTAESQKAALTPISGGTVPTSNGNLMNALPSFGPQPLIDKQTTGARSTRDQGIANTIIGAANVVGKYGQQAQAAKQRTLAVDLERVLQANAGLDQANQVLAQSPKDPAALAAKKQNENILNGILSDPKRQKQIAKALDINFADPSQNKGMEHGAMQQATASYAEQLQAKMPTQLAPNPQAVQQYEMNVKEQNAIANTIKDFTPLAVAQTKADQDERKVEQDNAQKDKDAKTKSDEELQKAKIEADDKRYNADNQLKSAYARSNATVQASVNNMTARMGSANIMANAITDKAVNAKSNPQAVIKTASDGIKKFTELKLTNDKIIAGWQKVLLKQSKGSEEAKTSAALIQKAMLANDQLDKNIANSQQALDKAQAGVNNGNSSGKPAGSGSSQKVGNTAPTAKPVQPAKQAITPAQAAAISVVNQNDPSDGNNNPDKY
jgi:hypothetical protein